MQPNNDWIIFQEFFLCPFENSTRSTAPQPIYVVVENGRILSLICGDENLAEYRGAELQDLVKHNPNRRVIAFDRNTIDTFWHETQNSPHFLGQINILTQLATENMKVYNTMIPVKLGRPKHFLLKTIGGRLSKVLPHAFGVFVRLSTSRRDIQKELLILFKDGKVEGFHIPDLTNLGPDRVRDIDQVSKFLTERYFEPVIVAEMDGRDWEQLCSLKNPWRQVFRKIRRGQVRVSPKSRMLWLLGMLGR